MSRNVPAWAMPESSPVEELKLAQLGRFCMVKLSAVLLAASVAGKNEYLEPERICVAGLPEIVRRLATLIENAGSVAVACPSLTLIWILAYVPTLDGVGVPVSRPVPLSKDAQLGILTIV